MPGPEGQKIRDQRLQELEGQKAKRRRREAADPTPAGRRRAAPRPAPAAAPGGTTAVPRHPEAKLPEPEERHPTLLF